MKNRYISVEGYAIKGVHDYSYFTPRVIMTQTFI